MSASDKKKLRKEQDTARLTEKQVAARKEARKLRIYTITACVAMALVLVCFVGILVSNSGLLRRHSTALVAGDHKVSTVELNYTYMDTINNFYRQYGSYASLFGLDTSKALDDQMQDETNKVTWADYFLTQAQENLRSTYALVDAAKAAGHTLSDEDQASIDAAMEDVKAAAKKSNMGASDYLKALYGNGSNLSSFKNYLTNQAMASSFYAAHQDSLTYDDAAIRAKESEDFSKYSSFSYNTYYVSASDYLEGGTKDDEGKVTYSDEEKAASVKKAEEVAQSLVVPDIDSVEALDKAIAALDVNKEKENAASTAYTDTLYSSVSTVLRDWVTDSSRKEGDKTTIKNVSSTAEDGTETINGYYVVYYVGTNDNAFALANVRHILVSYTGGTYDSNTGATTYSDEEKNAAKTKAEDLLAQWESGAKTEDSFATLANENSTDPGSNTKGGLYEEIYPGQMVTAFNDWCFDEARKPGDTGVVQTDYGYHVMYYSGDAAITYRDYMIRNDLINADMESWYTALVDAMTVTVKSTSGINTHLVLGSATSAY